MVRNAAWRREKRGGDGDVEGCWVRREEGGGRRREEGEGGGWGLLGVMFAFGLGLVFCGWSGLMRLIGGMIFGMSGMGGEVFG